MSGLENFVLEDDISYRMNILTKRMTTTISEVYNTQFGLSTAEYRILVWTFSHDKVYAKDISNHCLMDKNTISRAVIKLEKRELITRKIDEKDQRNQLIFLTKEGQHLICKILPTILKCETDMLDVLDDEELKNLSKILYKLEEKLINKNSIKGKVSPN